MSPQSAIIVLLIFIFVICAGLLAYAGYTLFDTTSKDMPMMLTTKISGIAGIICTVLASGIGYLSLA